MELWIAEYDDGDYYCEGHHLIGIFGSEQLAKDAIDKFEKDATDPKNKNIHIGANWYEYGTYSVQLNEIVAN